MYPYYRQTQEPPLSCQVDILIAYLHNNLFWDSSIPSLVLTDYLSPLSFLGNCRFFPTAAVDLAIMKGGLVRVCVTKGMRDGVYV